MAAAIPAGDKKTDMTTDDKQTDSHKTGVEERSIFPTGFGGGFGTFPTYEQFASQHFNQGAEEVSKSNTIK